LIDNLNGERYLGLLFLKNYNLGNVRLPFATDKVTIIMYTDRIVAMNERKLIQDTTAGSIVIVKLVGNLAVGLSRSRDLVSTAYVQLSARRCTCNSGLVTL